MEMYTCFSERGPEGRDPRTGFAGPTKITVLEVLSHESDLRKYVVNQTIGVVLLRTQSFVAPGYMGDDCGRPQAAAARALAREWVVDR